MAHKVRVDVKFKDLEQYQIMKKHLDGADIKFDAFVSYALDYTWNEMLREYSKQLKKEGGVSNEVAGDEPAGDSK